MVNISSDSEKRFIGNAIEKNTVAEEKILENFEPFNEVFFKSCFSNSLFPIIRYFKKSILPTLINDVIIYKIDGQSSDTVLDVEYMPVKLIDALTDDMGIGFDAKDKSEDIVSDVIMSLHNDKPVCISVDCYYEPMRQDTYGKIHMAHTVAIYGYENSKQLFHIIEHKFRDTLSYKKYTIAYEDLLKAYEEYISRFHNLIGTPSYYDFYLKENGSNTSDVEATITKYRIAFVNNIVENRDVIDSSLEELRVFIEELKNTICNENSLWEKKESILISLNNITNGWNVQKYRIEQLFDNSSELLNISNRIINKWKLIRTAIVKYMYSKVYNEKKINIVLNNLEEVHSLENEFYDYFE